MERLNFVCPPRESTARRHNNFHISSAHAKCLTIVKKLRRTFDKGKKTWKHTLESIANFLFVVCFIIFQNLVYTIVIYANYNSYIATLFSLYKTAEVAPSTPVVELSFDQQNWTLRKYESNAYSNSIIHNHFLMHKHFFRLLSKLCTLFTAQHATLAARLHLILLIPKM